MSRSYVKVEQLAEEVFRRKEAGETNREIKSSPIFLIALGSPSPRRAWIEINQLLLQLAVLQISQKVDLPCLFHHLRRDI